MKLRYLIATLLAALLGATAAVVLSAGLGDPAWLANTPVGRWLGIRPPSLRLASDVIPAIAGQPVGPLTLTDLNGLPQALPSGRRVLVNVWASWCTPCRDEMPVLDAFARTQDAHGVVVIGIAEDDPAVVRDFLRKSPISYAVLLDDAQWRAGTRLGNQLGALPYSALLDGDGRVIARHMGAFASVNELTRWIERPQ